MTFEWDEKKNQLNLEKHGLSFEDAELVFASKTITFEDDRKNYGEERFITLATLKSRVIIVVHTERNFVTRIISMRKANEREKKIYFKRLKETG
ncbi:MAG: BrnT family toxin [Gammaproteobacteria bacterium]|nr:BrnT family toxin [Gammaproteobacteria bacterium]